MLRASYISTFVLIAASTFTVSCDRKAEVPAYRIIQVDKSLPKTSSEGHSHGGHTHRHASQSNDHTAKGLVIRLENPTEFESLKSISKQIRNTDQTETQTLYLSFFLPEMKTDPPAWAIARFTPELRLRILGLKPKEIEKLRSSASSVEASVGIWLNARRGGGLIVIDEKKSQYTVTRIRPNARDTYKLERTNENPLTFQQTGTSISYRITPEGRLNILTKHGVRHNIPPLRRR